MQKEQLTHINIRFPAELKARFQRLLKGTTMSSELRTLVERHCQELEANQ